MECMVDTPATETEALQRVPFFATLPEHEVQALAALLQPAWYEQGECIIRQGDPGDSFFLIRSGSVKVTSPTQSGTDMILDILGSGECFGEQALLDGEPRSASVYALEPGELWVLSREQFLHYLRTYPTTAIEIIRVLSIRLRRMTAQVVDAYSRGLAERLASRLLELSRRHGKQTESGIQLGDFIGATDLATSVGTSRARVLLLLSEWEHEGLVRVREHGEILILQPERLQALVR
jgi:CRP/FNR family transcriptional regulator, cyclic AMP receptor protein